MFLYLFSFSSCIFLISHFSGSHPLHFSGPGNCPTLVLIISTVAVFHEDSLVFDFLATRTMLFDNG